MKLSYDILAFHPHQDEKQFPQFKQQGKLCLWSNLIRVKFDDGFWVESTNSIYSECLMVDLLTYFQTETESTSIFAIFYRCYTLYMVGSYPQVL